MFIVVARSREQLVAAEDVDQDHAGTVLDVYGGPEHGRQHYAQAWLDGAAEEGLLTDARAETDEQGEEDRRGGAQALGAQEPLRDLSDSLEEVGLQGGEEPVGGEREQ